MNPEIGRIVLGVYAALLGVGGIVGYRKAGSRASLIAGLASAALVVGTMVLSFQRARLGFLLGAALAAALLGVFAIRFARGHKFMPSGLLTWTSVLVLALLVAQCLST